MVELKARTVRKKQRQLERSRGIPAYVSSLGARRRIEALATLGYSRDDLYRMLNPDATVVQGSWVRSTRIHIRHHQAIDRLYRHLVKLVPVAGKMIPREGPSPQAKLVAARRCWGGPWDWDDIDDPREAAFCCRERAHAEALVMHKAWLKSAPGRAAFLAELERTA